MFEVYLDSTPDAIFDDARIKRIANRLMRFLISAYGAEYLDDYDDYVQEALVKLWQNYRQDPNALMGYSDGKLYALAKGHCRNAMQNAYSRKCRHHHTAGQRHGPKTLVKRMFTMSELVCGVDERDHEDVAERILARATTGSFTHDSPQVRQADTRLDLEDLLNQGLARLSGRQLHETRILIQDVAAGYSLIEIAERSGWTENRVRVVMRLMRSTFIEITTGQKRQPGEGISKPKATDKEIQRLQQLQAQGLSYRKVAAMIGRSPAFVQHWAC